MAIEQIYYTWAPEGLEGLGKFQLVAATRRMLRPSPVKRLAMQLCVYERHQVADALPESIGWLTKDDFRFAFRRWDIGLDAMGRRGNFAAHILVGSRAELPVEQIARSFGTKLWWDGRLESVPSGGALRPADSLDVEPGVFSSMRDPELEGVVSQLLTAPAGRVVLGVTPELLMRAAALVGERLPGALDATSVSSFEGPRLADSFDLLGQRLDASSSTRRPVVQGQVKLAAAFTTRAAGADLRIVEGAWRSASTRERPLQHYGAIAAAHQVEREGAGATEQQLAWVLGDALVANDLLLLPGPRKLAAKAYVDNAEPLTGLVDRVLPELSVDVVEALVTSMVEPVADADAAALASLGARLSARHRRVLVELARAAVGQVPEESIDRWPPELVAAALGFGRPDVARRDRLVERGAHQVVELAGADITDGTFARVVSVASRRGLLKDRLAGQVLLRYPNRLAACAEELGVSRLASMVQHSDTRSTVAVLARGGRIAQAQALGPIVRDGLGRVNAADRPQMAADLAERLELASQDWDRIVADLFRDVTSHLRDRFDRPYALASLARVGRMAGDERLRAWGRLFGALADTARPTGFLNDFAKIPAGDLRAASEVTIDVVMATRFFTGRLDGVLAELARAGRLSGADSAQAALRGGLRGLHHVKVAEPGGRALSYVADLIDTGQLQRPGLLSRGSDPEVDRLAARVAVSARTRQDWEKWENVLGTHRDGPGLRWLRSVKALP